MEYLIAVSLFMLLGLVILREVVKSISFKVVEFEYVGSNFYTDADNFEKTDEIIRHYQEANPPDNVIDFEKRKTASTEKAKTDDKEFWDDRDALEAELERIGTGGEMMIGADPLDHARRVAERIEEIKENSTPVPAA